MRILIVEDELVSRTKMETIVETFGECQMAENGHQAIEMFQKAVGAGEPFQLVTLDIEMPDITGIEVLQRMRRLEVDQDIGNEQRSKIVMVTCQSDHQQVLTCIQSGCDDYIAKPFDIHIIREKLANLGLAPSPGDGAGSTAKPGTMTSDDIIKDINFALRSGKLSLPVQPHISVKFQELRRSDADMDQIVELLKQDMAIVSRLIKVANSALYRGFGVVENIEQAVGRLGLSSTAEMVTALANQRLYVTKNRKYSDMLQRLWQHALATGFAADILSQFLSRKPSIDTFTAGLLHDIGALALILIISEMDKRGRFGEDIPMETLIETIESFHVKFGEKLMQKWGFEADYVEAVRYHSDLVRAESVADTTLVVHLANLVAKTSGYVTFDQGKSIDPAEALSTQKLKLRPEQLELIRQKVSQRMQSSTLI